jgi:hypothetical protein
MIRRILVAAATLPGLWLQPAAAQPKPPDPDWPCQQTLVPKLRAGSYWATGVVPTGDYTWHDNPKLTHLIESVVDRDAPDSEVQSDLMSYLKTTPNAPRAKLFGYIVDEANDERQQVISRIEELSRRQRALDDTIGAISRQIDAIPAGAPETTRADLVGQRDFNIHTFQEAQHTMQYVCEVPGAFDRRLGLIARTLEK